MHKDFSWRYYHGEMKTLFEDISLGTLRYEDFIVEIWNVLVRGLEILFGDMENLLDTLRLHLKTFCKRHKDFIIGMQNYRWKLKDFIWRHRDFHFKI
jgi:hypothetical protein